MIYDVAIVGAGLVGQALAITLARHNMSVALIDPALKHPLVAPESNSSSKASLNTTDSLNAIDPRVSALTAETQAFLESIGVWPCIPLDQCMPYQFMKVWDADGTGGVNFSAADLHTPNLGTIVENSVTLSALRSVVDKLDHITQFAITIQSVGSLNEDSTITLTGRDPDSEDNIRIPAKLIVGADGARSLIRQWSGVKTREWDYHHDAIITTVMTENDHEDTAWQRFRPEGPLAFLPLSAGQNLCSIVWSTERSEASELMQLTDDQFCQKLSEAFEFRLGTVEGCAKRYSVPLYQRHAVDYAHDGVVLVGDAAHSIHPLAGQGVNLGFKDVKVLADELTRAQKSALPLNDTSVLQRYQRRRQGDNLLTMAAMEGFKRLFESDNIYVRLLRNQGMRWFDALPSVKNHIALQAMGLKTKT